MGTIINGNKWIGACVNGNVVSGIVKNGAVFYKKNQQELYKRRIMVGDNLKGKTIYPEFTTPSEDMFAEGRKSHMIIFNNNNNESIYLAPRAEGGSEGFCEYIIASISNAEYIYRKNESNIIKQNNTTIFNDKDYFVTKIYDDFFSYRCLYIEDSNIRPVQVGDMITKNTVFYFNFPDDIYLELPETRTQIITINGHSGTGIAIDKDTIYSNSKGTSVAGWEYYLYRDGEVITNKSKVEGLKEIYGGMIVGEVTKILKDNPVYQYILVDTTTLGN